jgi:hypothetical protein
LRCLIQDVTLDAFSRPGFSLLHVRWHTGTIATVEVERPGSGHRKAVEIIERVREPAQHHPDDRIADILNAEGVTNPDRRVVSVWLAGWPAASGLASLGTAKTIAHKLSGLAACQIVWRVYQFGDADSPV